MHWMRLYSRSRVAFGSRHAATQTSERSASSIPPWCSPEPWSTTFGSIVRISNASISPSRPGRTDLPHERYGQRGRERVHQIRTAPGDLDRQRMLDGAGRPLRLSRPLPHSSDRIEHVRDSDSNAAPRETPPWERRSDHRGQLPNLRWRRDADSRRYPGWGGIPLGDVVDDSDPGAFQAGHSSR